MLVLCQRRASVGDSSSKALSRPDTVRLFRVIAPHSPWTQASPITKRSRTRWECLVLMRVYLLEGMAIRYNGATYAMEQI